ncbi:coiled-coil domain-containing protein 102A-like isoform X2 [Dreissena polymorpha]|uniref:Coiled-coil domain-containing protein 102A n=2 Tax=Dreissena polymorpha TaxID=45954 RepID=A0A9D4EG40_DREPO|nr:coiled-coil domain-containing protein 102A-like isoform X2 [Dreissena polymorpha]KAH3779033.1 hypothetical protein DPMN_180512 [Dreissena polymorpha]
MSQKLPQGPGPKGDVSYLRATPGPQFPVAPSPLPAMDGNHGNHIMNAHPQQHSINSDLEDKLELQQRELDEIRARASQMEKTMRWWSDCTSNWREKWSKVRNERNKAREENRQLRGKLDLLIKENNSLKREKEELVNSNKTNTDKNVEKKLDLTSNSASNSAVVGHGIVHEGTTENAVVNLSDESVQSKVKTTPVKSPLKDSGSQTPDEFERKVKESGPGMKEDKLTLMELRLNESQKTISGEREEKTQLVRSLEDVRHELASLRVRYEELKQSKQELEIQLERVKEQHQDDLGRLTSDLQDEQTSRSSMDRRLSELRVELEKLQRENADEWGRRERLETDKLSLERDNKKLRSQVSDLEEQVERKSNHASTVVNKDLKTLQAEVSERNKELADLKHAHSKLKKSYQTGVTDLDHSNRRCEQFEAEVKKLRSRVEELKHDLAVAEDEVDTQSNSVRKVQRTNDELQEQVDNLNVQVEHLQSRLRRASVSGTTVQPSSLRTFSPDLHALELDDDTDDDFSEGT